MRHPSLVFPNTRFSCSRLSPIMRYPLFFPALSVPFPEGPPLSSNPHPFFEPPFVHNCFLCLISRTQLSPIMRCGLNSPTTWADLALPFSYHHPFCGTRLLLFQCALFLLTAITNNAVFSCPCPFLYPNHCHLFPYLFHVSPMPAFLAPGYHLQCGSFLPLPVPFPESLLPFPLPVSFFPNVRFLASRYHQ